MAVIAQEYYNILKTIQTELRVKDTSIASPNYVNVNLATRTIDLSSGGYKDFLSVEKDHRAETIYFEVPRYFDDVDLASKNIIIEYQNKDGNFTFHYTESRSCIMDICDMKDILNNRNRFI